MHLKESDSVSNKNDYIQTTRDSNNRVIFDPNQTFGHTETVGLQHKGMAHIGKKTQFVKLDDLNPTEKGNWKGNFDYQYSSVSDAIVTCLVNNMENDPRFESVKYTFEQFDNDGKQTTGTVSDNYLKENEVEHIVSIGRKSTTHTNIPINDYMDIADANADNRLAKLVAVYESDHMSKDDAKHFLVQQAGFDMLTGNSDRVHNPSNFVMAYNTETKTSRPINLDYGRCLQMVWTQTTEDRFDFDSSFADEVIEETAADVLSVHDGLFHSMDALNDHGFQPFKINKQQLHQDLDALANRLETENAPCKTFAKMKIEAFKLALESDKALSLWNDTSVSLDLEDLNETQYTNG